MKKQTRKLRLILKIKGLEPERFYGIRIYREGIHLQGYTDPLWVPVLQKLFEQTGDVNLNGFLNFKQNHLTVTLS